MRMAYGRAYIANSLSASVATGAESFFSSKMFCGGADHLKETKSVFCESVYALRG